MTTKTTYTAEQSAALYVLLEECDIDPFKIVRIKLFPAMAVEFLEGRWTEAQFIDNCRKINILNGGRLNLTEWPEVIGDDN